VDEKSFLKLVKAGDVDAVRQALSESPSLVSVRDGDASTPLHWAAWKGHPEIAEILLDSGADIAAHNQNGHWGTTPLHAAAHGNRPAVVKLLIERGADVNQLKASGVGTPLAETKLHNASAAARVLKAAGAVE
jgi:ankyrin repeat protein